MGHYSTIKNFSGFLHSQYSKHRGKYFYCSRVSMESKQKRENRHEPSVHYFKSNVKYWKTFKPQRTTYPEQGTTPEFKNIHKMLMQPFVGYADIECTLKSVNEVEDVAAGIVPLTEKKRKEEQYQSHKPVFYFTKFVSIDSESRARKL